MRTWVCPGGTWSNNHTLCAERMGKVAGVNMDRPTPARIKGEVAVLWETLLEAVERYAEAVLQRLRPRAEGLRFFATSTTEES